MLTLLTLLTLWLACAPAPSKPEPVTDPATGTGASAHTAMPTPRGDSGPSGNTDTGNTNDTGNTDTGDGNTDTGVGVLSFEVRSPGIPGWLHARALQDRDGDGLDELLVTGGGYVWRVEPPAPAVKPVVVSVTAADALLVGVLLPGSVGDHDGDGLDDVWVAVGSTAYLLTSLPAAPVDVVDVAVASITLDDLSLVFGGDVDGNGAVDLFVHEDSTGTVHWFEGPFQGDLTIDDAVASWDGSLAPNHTHSNGRLHVVGDVTGDGLPDLLVGSDSVERSWLLSVPPRTDGSLNDIAVAGFFSNDVGSEVLAGDIDGDGVRDLIVGTTTSLPGTHWFATDVTSGVSAIEDVAHTTLTEVDHDVGRCYGIAMADLDGDGFDDFVAGCPFGYYQSDVFVIHGPVTRGDHELDASATAWVTSTTYPEEHIGYSLAVFDLDNDGDAELAYGATENATYTDAAGDTARLIVTEAL